MIGRLGRFRSVGGVGRQARRAQKQTHSLGSSNFSTGSSSSRRSASELWVGDTAGEWDYRASARGGSEGGGRCESAEVVDTAGIESADATGPEGEGEWPIFTLEQVSSHKTKEAGVWVVFKDGVYDITRFVNNHPGGRDKIMMAAGGDIGPFWNLYQQHFNSSLPQELLS
ncbi:cytochrome b5-like heme/steroid binding domain-containing protein, partial [Ochromonadaceae sp. CCMP2298]